MISSSQRSKITTWTY